MFQWRLEMIGEEKAETMAIAQELQREINAFEARQAQLKRTCTDLKQDKAEEQFAHTAKMTTGGVLAQTFQSGAWPVWAPKTQPLGAALNAIQLNQGHELRKQAGTDRLWGRSKGITEVCPLEGPVRHYG